MPKESSTASAAIAESVVPAKTKSLTNWAALRNFLPVEFICASYAPYHKVDISCHSRLRLDVDQIATHIRNDHSGGFMFKLKSLDKPTTFWERFSELGIESADFRCEVCDKQVPFHPHHIGLHMKPHSGKSRRVRPGEIYNMTLRIGAPEIAEDDAFETFG